MGHVIIGMDPHKRSATIEVIDSREGILAQGRFGTDRDGYQAMLAAGRGFPDRAWAVEGCGGIGRHIAQRLVADGEPVAGVPAKLSRRRGCSLPARAARPMPPTLTRWPSWRCAPMGCRLLRRTARPSRCGCWLTAVTGWATPAPAR